MHEARDTELLQQYVRENSEEAFVTGSEHLNRSLDEIGLELMPGRESVEMLVIEKAK